MPCDIDEALRSVRTDERKEIEMARKKIKAQGGQHVLIRAVTGPNFEGVGNNALKDIRKIDKRISTHPVLKRFVKE